MFRRSVAFQRCVIPATGFYEWDSAKHKYFFQMPGQPIYLAGIYDNISGVNCFIILTTAPNDSVAPVSYTHLDVYKRQPSISAAESSSVAVPCHVPTLSM